MRWINLEPIIQSEIRQKEKKQILCINAGIWNPEKWYWWICMQGSSGNADRVTKLWTCEKKRVRWTGRAALKPAYSVQFSRSVVSDSLWPHGLQHTRLPCPSPTPGVYSNSCPLSRWRHPAISSSVGPFSRLQSFPASGSFPMSQLFSSDGQSIGVSASASVLPMNIQDWFPLGLTGWISLQSRGLSRVFSNTTVQKHQFFSAQLSLWSIFYHM